jgi:hypothetical protein
MVDITELAKQVGCVVELTFSDRQIVRAKLQTVDVDESEIMYRVAELVAPGSAPLRTGTPGAAVIADIGDLVQFKCVE